MRNPNAAILALAVVLAGAPARAQQRAPLGVDTVLVNGRIVTVDAQASVHEALAIRGDRIVALGASADIRRLAGDATRVIDLQGRTVIPGLIDSHMHAVRAGLSFATEVNWVGARSLSEALGRIREAARAKGPGAWLIVAGGWNADQFVERRRPTQAKCLGHHAAQKRSVPV